jgi:AcrR family transcriptional regulator
VSVHYPKTSTRKPKQARAKFTQEALVDAATQVLRAQGYDRFNTNRVAEQAGVSIGSLYQYFPNKQALIEAIVVRHVAVLASTIAASLTQARALPVGDAMDLLVQATMDVYASDLDLHRVVHEQIPKHQADAAVDATLAQLTHWVAELLRAHRQTLRVMDHHLAADMVVNLVKDTACRIMLGTLVSPDHAGAVSVTTATRELCLMVRVYLGLGLPPSQPLGNQRHHQGVE